jgi:hypothetical protein
MGHIRGHGCLAKIIAAPEESVSGSQDYWCAREIG